MLKKPTPFLVFKGILKAVKKEDLSIKKDGDIYFTAVSFKKVMQKVYFDTKKEIVSFTSLNNKKESVDGRYKIEWKEKNKMQLKEIF